MGKISDSIKSFKEKREKLIRLQQKIKEKRLNCDTIQFYEDSIKLGNFNEGMVIIITKDKVIKEKVSRYISHESVAKNIINDDFDNVNGDFGNVISEKYGYVFIRIVSILSGASMIYYPNDCNEFQIRELRKFNEEVNTFNAGKRKNLKACFDYHDKGDTVEYNIDNVIDKITKKKNASR